MSPCTHDDVTRLISTGLACYRGCLSLCGGPLAAVTVYPCLVRMHRPGSKHLCTCATVGGGLVHATVDLDWWLGRKAEQLDQISDEAATVATQSVLASQYHVS